jgi:hypothetical protein
MNKTLSSRSQPRLRMRFPSLALVRPSRSDLDEEASQTFVGDGQERLPILLCKPGLCFVIRLTLMGVLEPDVSGKLSGCLASFHLFLLVCLIQGGEGPCERQGGFPAVFAELSLRANVAPALFSRSAMNEKSEIALVPPPTS